MRIVNAWVLMLGLLLSTDVSAKIDQMSFYSLGTNLDAGNPRLIWKEAYSNQPFVITRLHRGQLAQCPDPNEIRIYSPSENLTKCKKTIIEGNQGAYSLIYASEINSWRYTDKSVAIDEADPVELTSSSTFLQFPNPDLEATNEWIDIDVTNIVEELMGLPNWNGATRSICFIGKNYQATGKHEFGFRDSIEGVGVAPRLILDFH